MRFSVFLLVVCVALRSNFHVASEITNDGNLFLDSGSEPEPEFESDSLFPDNTSLLSGDIGDVALAPSSLLDEPISPDLDWTDRTDPVGLAGSGDLCEVAEEVQYAGRIRAREDANSCSSPDHTTNLLQLPGLSDLENLIQGMSRRPKTKPKEIPYPPPLILAPAPEDDDDTCLPPWPIHLCCIYPEYDKMVVDFGVRVYAVVRKCRPSK